MFLQNHLLFVCHCSHFQVITLVFYYQDQRGDIFRAGIYLANTQQCDTMLLNIYILNYFVPWDKQNQSIETTKALPYGSHGGGEEQGEGCVRWADMEVCVMPLLLCGDGLRAPLGN